MTEIAMGGLRLRFLQDKSDTDGSLTAFEMTVQPNARMPVAHYHESWDETVYGLSGTTIWRIEGRDHLVAPAESLFIRRGKVHGFRNDGGKAAVCLCILTPGVLGSDYFAAMADLLATSNPDPARMKAVMTQYGLIPDPSG